jgi:hypothetical protein
MGCFSPDIPAAPSASQTMRETLQAQVDLAPQLYASEANPTYGQPAYVNLELANLGKLLNGSPGGTTSYTTPGTASQTGWYDKTGNFVSPGELQTPPPAQTDRYGGTRNFFGPVNSDPFYVPGTAPQPGAVWHSQGDTFDVTHTQTSPAQPGVNQLLAQQSTAQRTADIGDVANLGPQARQAMLDANPDNAVLLAKLNQQANEGLDAGTGLTPDEQRAMQQESRAAFAARGMGGSDASISDELLKQFNLGQTLLRQRQAFAQSVVGNNQAVVGDPFLQVLGRSSGAMQAAQGAQQQSGPGLFNPMAMQNYYSGVYNNQVQGALATPTTYQLIGQGFNTLSNQVQAVGSIMGSMGK